MEDVPNRIPRTTPGMPNTSGTSKYPVMTSLVDAPIVRKTAISLDCVRINRSRETAITSPLMNNRIPRMNGIDFDKLSLSSRSNSALNWPRSRTYPSAPDSFIACVSVSLVVCNSMPSFSSVSLKSKAGVPSKSMLRVFRANGSFPEISARTSASM